jgi:hypothetical protein
MHLHVFYCIHVVSNQQHVVGIQRYIYEMTTLFLGIYTVINFSSHKNQTKDICVIDLDHKWISSIFTLALSFPLLQIL